MEERLVIAIPIFDGVTALDAIGPFEVLGIIPGAEVMFVGDAAGAVIKPSSAATNSFGLRTTHCFHDVPHPQVIVVPGGPPRSLPLHHAPLLQWLRQAHETSLFTASVCTGSLLLGAAGLLPVGIEAATHWSAYDKLSSYGAKPTAKRCVREGKIVTAAGVSSGIDMAIYLASLLADEMSAKAIQLIVEYDPQPPFDTGSVDKAGPEVVAKARKFLTRS